ncbi:DUF3536 domain-containing protein [Desulfovibrio sp. OttesenSCG-928-A18]|nr:DUF3536 domain-containing protein [Desulfovibrio sp. OttesenSCG-928-A18]
MSVSLCIHGHFYQPPRENPWLGSILNEASAAPMRNWNERILRESYAPLAFARRLDAQGRIADILNCYEWMSFNAGPTLLQWMREAAPETLARMQKADAVSLGRWGHGNAMAQVYHHIIMPLADELDRALETQWAIDDFRYHFKREPEGMWLSECAVDIPSLESLAAKGIRFVILAPRQARALVSDTGPDPVDEASLNTGRPYKVRLPSGACMAAIFYHGPLSQSIAFEGLLKDGELFWQRIEAQARELEGKNRQQPLLTIATDGETYGHHFTFGEMALAHVLAQGYAGRGRVQLTNPASYLAVCPPEQEILLHEPSSWSCVHGVERWRSNCGCTDGGHAGWNQNWRKPLRDALDIMRKGVHAWFGEAGPRCFSDPRAALMDYGRVLADSSVSDDYARQWFSKEGATCDRAWKLLAMQEQSLAAFASCAWFFDDIARIEPENALTFALRALELLVESGGPDLTQQILPVLEKAVSNQPEAGTGRTVFEQVIAPRREDAASVCLLAWILLAASGKLPEPGASASYAWPNISVELFPQSSLAAGGEQRGSARVRQRHEAYGKHYSYTLTPPAKLLADEQNPDRSFLSLAMSGIRLEELDETRDSQDGVKTGPAQSQRRCAELAHQAQDWLLSLCLEHRERTHRPQLMAEAAHAASLLRHWGEAQHDIPTPEFWTDFLPYLLPVCMRWQAISDSQIAQVATIVRLHLSNRGRRLTMHLAVELLLAALDAAAGGHDLEADGSDAAGEGRQDNDRTLARWAGRARLILPDISLWSVQNRLWTLGPERFPALAKELGFIY